MSYYVYGFTDRFCGNGFPACDGPIATLEEAKQVLAEIGNRGFGYVNEQGHRGWIADTKTGETVFPKRNTP